MKYNLSFSGRSAVIFSFRFFWSRHPYLLYQTYSRLRYPNTSITSNTDLLIEGFGRSGSSFTSDSFKIVNSNKINIAWNQKSPSAIYEAAKWRIPTLVLIRDPKSVVLSYINMNQQLPIKLLLKEYTKYYENIWKYKDYYVVSTNEEIWKNFNIIVKRINNKFKTELKYAASERELRKEVKNYQDRDYNKKYSKTWDETVKRTVNYPTEFKKLKKAEIELIYNQYQDDEIKNVAFKWYEKYKELLNLKN